VIRKAAALVLVMTAVVLLQQAIGGSFPRTIALALGFALIAASLLGEVAERIRLPRLSGYLVFGLICGPYLLNVITASMARDLQLVNGLAIALIALIAGIEINIDRLKKRLRAIAAIGAITLIIMYVSLGLLLMAVWPWLPIAPDATGMERVAMVLVLTTILVSFSPTVTIAVVAESRSRGPLSELVIAIVVLGDLVLILAFTLVMQFARNMAGGADDGLGLLARVSWEILGSLAFGVLVGAIFAIYLRAVGRELTIALIILCVVLSIGGQTLHLEPLLAALAAGLVIENVAAARADMLRDALERSALPVLVIFFAAAGASLQLDALAAIGVAAALLGVARVASIRLGTHLGLRAAGVMDAPSHMLWMGLVSQAGVTLGLSIIVASEFSGWGPAVQMLAVAMIALHELIGPILFKAALSRAGEVGALDRETLAKA
jgi:Kef-type K+ transport system membrane component KefB